MHFCKKITPSPAAPPYTPEHPPRGSTYAHRHTTRVYSPCLQDSLAISSSSSPANLLPPVRSRSPVALQAASWLALSQPARTTTALHSISLTFNNSPLTYYKHPYKAIYAAIGEHTPLQYLVGYAHTKFFSLSPHQAAPFTPKSKRNLNKTPPQKSLSSGGKAF